MFGISILFPIRGAIVVGGSSAPYISNAGTLSGATVGTESTASPASYTGEDVTLSYQWYADSAPIPGETSDAFTPTAAQDGKILQLLVTATNSGGSHSRFTPGVLVARPAPTANGTIPDQSFDEDTGTETLATAGYFTGGGLVYSLVADGGLATINPSTGVVSFDTSEDVDVVTITVRATNTGGYAEQSFDVTIVVAAPTIIGVLPNRSFTEGTGVQTVAAAPAFSGKYLTYSLTAGSGIASINASTGVVSIPTVSIYSATTITVQAENSGGTATRSFTAAVTVAAPALSGAALSPIVATVGQSGVTLDASVAFTGTNRTYAISPSGSVASINSSTGLVTVSTVAQSDVQDFTITASNAAGSISYILPIRVNDVQPVITNPLTSLSYDVGDAAAVTDLAARVSGQNLQWTLVSGAPHATLGTSGNLTVYPNEVLTNFQIVVDVSNTGGTQRFTISLNVSGVAPVQTSTVPALTFTKGGAGTYNFAQHFSGTGLTFTRVGAPSYYTVNTAGLLSADTSEFQAASSFDLVVSNGVAPDITVSVSIRVQLAAPTAVGGTVGPFEYDEQTGVQTIPTAVYFTGEGLTYSLTSTGNGITINSTTGLISVPTATIFDDQPITVRAENSTSFATKSFLVSVLEVVSGDPRVPVGYPIAARPAPTTGQFYICFAGPTFWGDGNAAGDGLGTAGNLFMDLGGYRYVLSGAYGGVGVGAIGETFAVGPAPDTIPIDEVRGLPIGEGVIGESFVIGPIPDDFWAPGMDSAACLLLDAPPDLYGQTVPISVWAVNSHGRTGATVTTSVAISATTSDGPPEIDGDYLTSGSGDLLTANETELLYTAG